MTISVQNLIHTGLLSGVVQFTTLPPIDPVLGQLWYNPDTDYLYIWDNVSWSVLTGGSGSLPIGFAGGTENQILVKKSNIDYDVQWEDMIINIPESNYTKLLDQVDSTTLYLGEAVPESIESDPVWRIQRILFDSNGNVDEVRFAVGGNFDQIWTNRANLIYI